MNDDGLIKKPHMQCKGQPPTGAIILYGGFPFFLWHFSTFCPATSRYKPSRDTAQHTVVVKTNELSFFSTPNGFIINSSHSTEVYESWWYSFEWVWNSLWETSCWGQSQTVLKKENYRQWYTALFRQQRAGNSLCVFYLITLGHFANASSFYTI